MPFKKRLFSELAILYADGMQGGRGELLSLFERNFNQVYTCEEGEGAYDLFVSKDPDLIVTDIELKGDGFEMVESIRRYDPNIPIVILSKNSDKPNLFNAIRLRVNDYLLKPVNHDTLLKSLYQCAKKLPRFSSREHALADGCLYSFAKKSIHSHGQTIHPLTRHESDLLELLICKAGEVVTYAEIEEYVYHGEYMSSDAIKTLVKKLRKKIPDNTIQNFVSIGYLIP